MFLGKTQTSVREIWSTHMSVKNGQHGWMFGKYKDKCLEGRTWSFVQGIGYGLCFVCMFEFVRHSAPFGQICYMLLEMQCNDGY